ncbi:tRNA-(ms[2]io[6]A)-hydroxylase [Portibacter lacus]|uniref:tRNA-(Ms[2]io[6]A)-hydroxylase n=1 Tax=Portibacter lacus TaxID=1099794 RepID=A0AA37WD01_9BACT|nr:tRNA-(ms[2]io[6]A)-hydroxylase [Portibacter lacus]GLR15449.1 tRNA-(ms[2]io[6]A)-hydroxylase [Portibacter lacus]
MKLNLDIKSPSSTAWITAVMENFDDFLQDHLDCERKASSMAMSFIAKYPDRKEIIPELIETGIEELEHFQQVYQLMVKRDIPLPSSMGEDPYVKGLIKKCHSGREERFLDRLLVASIVETRGAERFKMVSDALDDPELKRFYKMLWTSEAKHGHIFVKMALNYFPEDQVYKRLEWWVDQEQEVIDGLEIRAALH